MRCVENRNLMTMKRLTQRQQKETSAGCFSISPAPRQIRIGAGGDVGRPTIGRSP